MAEEDTSGFTLASVAFGFVLNIAILLGFSDIYFAMLSHFFGIERFLPIARLSGGAPVADLGYDLILRASLMAGIGFVALWMSSRMDFIDPKDDLFGIIAIYCGAYFLFSFIGFQAQIWYKNIEQDGVTFSELFLLLLLTPVAMLGTLFVYTYVLVCTSLFWAGLLCVPRIVIYVFTTHRLRKVWQAGKSDGSFDAPGVVGALGQRSYSRIRKRALLRDAKLLQREMDVHEVQLQDQKQQLTRSVEEDTKRFKVEAELARKLADIEERQIEIDELKKFLGKRDE